jgi:hypothetical protein
VCLFIAAAVEVQVQQMLLTLTGPPEWAKELKLLVFKEWVQRLKPPIKHKNLSALAC